MRKCQHIPVSRHLCRLQLEDEVRVPVWVSAWLLCDRDNEELDQRKAQAIASWDGVPRVSPNACIRDSVADELFDDVWREVMNLLEELLRKHWEKEHSGGSA